MTPPLRTVVVGAGQAGARCALTLREQGYTGEIVLLGDEPYLPYERPQLSKGFLAGTRTADDLLVAGADAYAGAGVHLRLGAAVHGVDLDAREVALGDGSSLSYTDLVLATGSVARGLPVARADGVAVLRTRDDAERIAAHPGGRAVVIGLGLVGAELCAGLVGRGYEVTAVEPETAPMLRAVGETLASAVASLHRAHGVDLRLGEQVVAVERSAGRSRVHLAAGATLDADLVVAGVGAAADTRLARAAGLHTRRGVVVDADGRTSAPGVHAVGDVAERFFPHLGAHRRVEHWQSADRQAAHTAAVVAGTSSRPSDEVPWFWSDQYDVQLQVSGWPDLASEHVVRGDPAALDGVVFGMVGDRVVSAAGSRRPREVRRAAALIQNRSPVRAELLADPAVDLRDLAAVPAH
ncbi:NAD(P)/FAD-dependent oxidoreductase [Jatrophihabitans sp. YIM 134969]